MRAVDAAKVRVRRCQYSLEVNKWQIHFFNRRMKRLREDLNDRIKKGSRLGCELRDAQRELRELTNS